MMPLRPEVVDLESFRNNMCIGNYIFLLERWLGPLVKGRGQLRARAIVASFSEAVVIFTEHR